MKASELTLLIFTIVMLAMRSSAYCDSSLNYAQTVSLIKTTMQESPSDYRKETYGAITFDNCRLDYSVAGTYPVGDLYNVKFSNIDFSTLAPLQAKTGNDYTPFMILGFDNYFSSRDGYQELKQRNLVINLGSEEKAEVLLKVFLRLGEICRTHGMAVVHNKQ